MLSPEGGGGCRAGLPEACSSRWAAVRPSSNHGQVTHGARCPREVSLHSELLRKCSTHVSSVYFFKKRSLKFCWAKTSSSCPTYEWQIAPIKGCERRGGRGSQTKSQLNTKCAPRPSPPQRRERVPAQNEPESRRLRSYRGRQAPTRRLCREHAKSCRPVSHDSPPAAPAFLSFARVQRVACFRRRGRPRFGWGSGRRLTLLLVREPRPARRWRPGLRLPKLERRREPARGEVGADANEIQGSRRPVFLHFSPSFPWVSLGRPDQMQTTAAWVKPPSYRPDHPERSFTKPEPIGAIFLFTRARA